MPCDLIHGRHSSDVYWVFGLMVEYVRLMNYWMKCWYFSFTSHTFFRDWSSPLWSCHSWHLERIYHGIGNMSSGVLLISSLQLTSFGSRASCLNFLYMLVSLSIKWGKYYTRVYLINVLCEWNELMHIRLEQCLQNKCLVIISWYYYYYYY